MEEEAANRLRISLPDKILLEILVRVKDDAAALFRCAIMCKGWCRLVVDPSFLRRCWPSFSFIGFLVKNGRKGKGWLVLPSPRSALCRRWRSLGSFLPASAGLLDGARPLVSNHGLLLLSLAMDPADKVVRLAVCNLLLGTCDLLPPLEGVLALRSDGYAVLTAADCVSNETHSSAFFKVVILRGAAEDEDERKYYLHTFSSDEAATWSVCTGYLDIVTDEDGFCWASRDPIVHRGTVQWIFGNLEDLRFYLLKLDARTYHISLTKLPFTVNIEPMNYPCLHTTVGGTMELLWMQEKGSQLEIWEQKNVVSTSEWIRTRTVKLKLSAMEENEETELHMLGEKCRTLLVTDSTQKRLYTADLETGTMEKVVEWPRMGRLAPGVSIPLEMDWPTIFLSHMRHYLG